MITDVSFFEPFYQAEKKKTFRELFDFLMGLSFDEDFYKKMNFYYVFAFGIPVPGSIGFLLYYYRGREHHDYVSLYTAAKILDDPNLSMIKCYYRREYNDCIKHNFSTLEKKYGEAKANSIKQKISFSMKNLDEEIIKKRNESIKNYASSRPESHNKAISISRKKKIIEIQTKTVYDSAKEASISTGICENYIRQACQNKRNLPFKYYSDYLTFVEDLL
jgi:hypothetical protein